MTANSGRVAIAGAAGAIGRASAAEFVHRGWPFRVIGRDSARLEAAFGGQGEIKAADIADPVQCERALAGVESAVYAVGLPYPNFDQHPVLMRKFLAAAQRTGVSRLIVVSSVYSYGRPMAPRVAESHPRNPEARKGQFRKEQEDIALAADREKNLRTLVLRLPDFYGPHAEFSLAHQTFEAAVSGGKATWLGAADLPHEFVFVPDVGPMIAELLLRDDSFGQAWNYGGPGTITGREFITAAYEDVGRQPTFRSVGPLVLRLGGLFNPMLRELVELRYLSETPVILDDSKLHNHLGTMSKTPYRDGIRQTVDWYRSRSAVRRS